MRSIQTSTARRKLQRRNITGRDGFIIAEALFRYIATEQMKPEHDQSWSNLQDARAIFNTCGGSSAAFADDYPGLTVSLTDEKAPRAQINGHPTT